jgi:transcriptional regulator with XRE-family HTH domain
MPNFEMNNDREWLLRMAEEEANCDVSAGIPSAEARWGNHSVSESARASIAKFLELSRRQMHESPESLAARADVDLAELALLERGRSSLINPMVLRKIATALGVDAEPLLTLAGLIRPKDDELATIAAQFAARLESVKPLEPQEEQALGWFKEQAFKPRSVSVAVG